MYDELADDGRRAQTVQQIADEFGVICIAADSR
jgi:hypothetical protein